MKKKLLFVFDTIATLIAIFMLLIAGMGVHRYVDVM